MIFFYDANHELPIKNSIFQNRTIVTITIEGALQKKDSIMNAINKIDKKSQMNEIFLFYKSTITSE